MLKKRCEKKMGIEQRCMSNMVFEKTDYETPALSSVLRKMFLELLNKKLEGEELKTAEDEFYEKYKDSEYDFENLYTPLIKQYELKITIKELISKAERKLNSHITIKIDNYIDNVNALYDKNPFFYDNAGLFWIWDWDEVRYTMKDEVDILNFIDSQLGFYGQTISSRIKNAYLEAFKRVGRLHIPKEPPKRWVQFKDKAISLRSGEIYDVTPDFFFCNPIPHPIGKNGKTPVMDKLIKEWVGEKYLNTIYEIIAYCCYTDSPIHSLVCYVGSGCNGKTSLLGLTRRFIGMENICSTELDILVESRFETAKLYKKLVCLLGETDYGTLQKTGKIKRIVTGEDVVGIEFKNKNPIDVLLYSKVIIASNSLPSTGDTSEGWFRRTLVIEFNNTFPEGKNILETIPEEEYSELAFKVCKMLPKLLDRGAFINQGTIEQRKERYIMASNPLGIFINKYCEIEANAFVLYGELYTKYIAFLNEHKKRKVKKKEFTSALEDEGFWIDRTSKKVGEDWINGHWIVGCKFRDFRDLRDRTTTYPIGILTEYKKLHESHESHEIIVDNPIPIHLKCNYCGLPESYTYDRIGRPVCIYCKDNPSIITIEEDITEEKTNKNGIK